MRHSRLTTTLVATALAAAACGASTTTTTQGEGRPGGPHPVGGRAPVTADSYAATLLGKVQVPDGAVSVPRAPSKALDGLPESPSLSETPTVVKRFWTVDQQASAVYAWLRQHGPGISLLNTGGAPSAQPSSTAIRYLAYQQVSLPTSMGAGYLFLTVLSTGPNTSAIGAYALTLAQPPRPATEQVPLDVSKAVVGWSLAAGGTPVLKVLTGPAASRLARDFNALRVDTAGMVHCPMIPTTSSDVTVTFTGGGHTWVVDIPTCPDIHVTRDGRSLPSLAFGNPFLADVKAYTGHLPQSGPRRAPGGVIPLMQPPSG